MGFLRKLFGRDTTTDVLELLEAQHQEVDELIEQLEAGGGRRRVLVLELADKLGAHATAEEQVFYPAVLVKQTSDLLRESLEEHLAIRRILSDLITMRLDAETFTAKLAVLKEQIAHHAHEEEEKALFPIVKDMLSADQRAALGNEVLVAYEEALAASPHMLVPTETDAAAPLPGTPRR
jgi:hemerythrin superfamily protein